MRKLLFLTAATIFGFAAMAQQKADDVIKVNADTYDFGKIKQGVPATTYFTITNITDKPVFIENSWAGCGCTTPSFTKEPFAAKQTTKIKVGYNAAAIGHFTKDVYVKLSGVQDPKIIHITGEVLDPNAFEAYTKTDEYKKAEKDRLAAEAKEAKEMKKADKKAKKNVTSSGK